MTHTSAKYASLLGQCLAHFPRVYSYVLESSLSNQLISATDPVCGRRKFPAAVEGCPEKKFIVGFCGPVIGFAALH
jgi:hypothetical protein